MKKWKEKKNERSLFRLDQLRISSLIDNGLLTWTRIFRLSKN